MITEPFLNFYQSRNTWNIFYIHSTLFGVYCHAVTNMNFLIVNNKFICKRNVGVLQISNFNFLAINLMCLQNTKFSFDSSEKLTCLFFT